MHVPDELNPWSDPAIASLQSIVDLAAAIGGRFGARTHAPVQRLRDATIRASLAEVSHVVLVLFDGFGDRQLEALVPGGALSECRRGALRSVFPSSTAPAITSLATALHPASHANPGWFCWSDELGAVVRTLPMDLRAVAGSPTVPDSFWDWRSASESCSVPVIALQPDFIADSAFSRCAWSGATRACYGSLDQLRHSVVDAVRATPEGAFIWAYAPQFDTVSHQKGWRSGEARSVASRFDAFFAALAQDLRRHDALLLATADHGFIDVEPACQLRLEDFPEIGACLSRPLCGEPRVAFCQVEPDRIEAFVRRFGPALSSAFHLFETSRLIETGWFGPGPVSPRLLPRIGTHALVARNHYTLVDCLPGEPTPRFIGMHGGIHPDEMRVPIVAARAGRPLHPDI